MEEKDNFQLVMNGLLRLQERLEAETGDSGKECFVRILSELEYYADGETGLGDVERVVEDFEMEERLRSVSVFDFKKFGVFVKFSIECCNDGGLSLWSDRGLPEVIERGCVYEVWARPSVSYVREKPSVTAADVPKLFAFRYCPCIHESSYATVSLHYSESGAVEAMERHRNREYLEYMEMASVIEDPDELREFVDDFGKYERWDVCPVEVLP